MFPEKRKTVEQRRDKCFHKERKYSYSEKDKKKRSFPIILVLKTTEIGSLLRKLPSTLKYFGNFVKTEVRDFDISPDVSWNLLLEVCEYTWNLEHKILVLDSTCGKYDTDFRKFPKAREVSIESEMSAK